MFLIDRVVKKTQKLCARACICMFVGVYGCTVNIGFVPWIRALSYSLCNMPWIINKVLLWVHDIIRNGVNIVPII